MRNQDVKQEIYKAGLKLWQVAEKLGVHPNTLSIWLRYELAEDKRLAIINAIESLKRETIAVE